MEDLEKYKGVVFKGSRFPDAPYNDDVKISFTKEMLTDYIPTISKCMADQPVGFRMLLIIMAAKEGFYKGSRSYRHNNPGNIGNTDSGANQSFNTLTDGILAQKEYIDRIVAGKSKTYPMGREVKIKPFYSKEIAKNVKTYGLRPWLPGYEFTFTGQIDQFVKIYSTGARAGNSYLNMIVSYFKNCGHKITPESKIQDVIKIS